MEKEPWHMKAIVLVLVALLLGMFSHFYTKLSEEGPSEREHRITEMNKNLEGTGIHAYYIDPRSKPARVWSRRTRKNMPSAEIDVQGKIKVPVEITYLGESWLPYYDGGKETWAHNFHYEVTYRAPDPKGLEYGNNAMFYALDKYMCTYDKEHFERNFAHGPQLGAYWGRSEGNLHRDEFAVQYFDE